MLTLRIYENAQSFYEKNYSDDTDIRIGRAEQCELVLKSKRVSREHCRLTFENGHWIAVDLNSQNGIRVNGKKTPSERLKNNDNLQVGDYRLEIVLPDDTPPDQAPVDKDDRTVLISDADIDDRTVVRNPDVFNDLQGNGNNKKRIESLIKDKRFLAGTIGLFCLFIIALFISSSSDNATPPEENLLPAEQKKTESMMSMESRHRMQAYLQSGKEQFAAGNFNEALVRFQAVLKIDSANDTAISYISQCRDKIIEMEEQKRRMADEEKLKMDRVASIVSKARLAVNQFDYSRAMEIITEAAFLAPDDDKVKTLTAEIKTAMAAENKRNEEARIHESALRKTIKRHFDDGQQFYDQGDYQKALKEWEQVIAMNVDTPETEHVKFAIVHLKKLLAENVREDYQKGKSYYLKKDYTQAAIYLDKVSQVLPDYQDTQTILAETVNKLESQAKKLFQEGLVYEGIGQNEKAAAKWREVLKTMPVESNEYYQKAMEKLR